MSLLLLKDARPQIAKVLNMHVNDERVVQYINEACEVVMLTHDWLDRERLMTFYAYNGSVTFPPEVVCPIKFAVNGVRGRPFGMHYEYLISGPGASSEWKYEAKNLVDAGRSPTIYDCDPDDPTYLALWNDSIKEYPRTVWLRGLDETGHEVRSPDGSIGETIVWTGEADENGVPEPQIKLTSNKFSVVTQVVKEVGAGYLHITTVDSEGDPSRVVSSLHPDETSPSYRRFTLHGVARGDEDGFTQIKGLFRIGFVPVIRDNDPIPINIIHALKLMVKAVWNQEHGEPNKAAVLEGQVERILTNQKNQSDVDDGLMDVDESYDMSDLGLGTI